MSSIVILDENSKLCETLKSRGNLNITSIYGDLSTVVSYLNENKVKLILLKFKYDNINANEIIYYLKTCRPNIKLIGLYDSTEEVVSYYNQNMILNRAISINSSAEELEKVIIDVIQTNALGDEIITKLLSHFEFNRSNIGYYYINRALNYCIDLKITQIAKINVIYSILSDEKNTSNRINWNVRKAIDSMIELTDRSVMERYFKYDMYPTPKVFLNGILDIYYKVH